MKETKDKGEIIFKHERVRSYTIKFEKNNDGLLSINKKNDGFNPVELLGLLSWAYSDILWQMKGNVEPDIVKREFVEQDEKIKP
jgi:hypothetical protein